MDNETLISDIRRKIAKFNRDRNWEKYHKPKDLLLALQEELGELSRYYTWLSEEEIQNIHNNPKKFSKIKEEMADIFIYMINFANRTKVDISEIIDEKIKKNNAKYPVKESKSTHSNRLLK